jgi:peroxiredoxin
MARTLSTMLALGTRAPDFALPDTQGHIVARADFAGRPLVVAFICNHCKFVKHVRAEWAKLSSEYLARGFAIVGINANDGKQYPEDAPDRMAEEVAQAGYHFPYLHDATQQVARAYHAACTPDFFVFDQDHPLVYRGQMDGSRPGNDVPITGADLRAALDAVLAGEMPSSEQKPSLGCNIKWKAGNEPEYFNLL